MHLVVLTGADRPLGNSVRARLDADPAVDRVVALDDRELNGADLKRALEGAAEIVHLADGVDSTRIVLEAAGTAGVLRLVLLSSALAYGAWPDNPVPLTEEASLRPNPGVGPAVDAAERERLAGEWRDAHPGATLAVLRPAVTVGAEAGRWRAPVPDSAQFLHVDDLASAVDIVRRQGLDGVFNVAPDGWIDGEELRALVGGIPRRRRPADPYARHSWVVANDRLKAAGWKPDFTNQQAFVAGHRAGAWSSVDPQRRQSLALAACGAALVAALAGLAVLVRWISRLVRPG